MNSYASLIGCQVLSWSLSYLGVLRARGGGGDPRSIAFWDPFVEIVAKRLEGWKRREFFSSLGEESV